jgi:hypothetical protein
MEGLSHIPEQLIAGVVTKWPSVTQAGAGNCGHGTVSGATVGVSKARPLQAQSRQRRPLGGLDVVGRCRERQRVRRVTEQRSLSAPGSGGIACLNVSR